MSSRNKNKKRKFLLNLSSLISTANGNSSGGEEVLDPFEVSYGGETI